MHNTFRNLFVVMVISWIVNRCSYWLFIRVLSLNVLENFDSPVFRVFRNVNLEMLLLSCQQLAHRTFHYSAIIQLYEGFHSFVDPHVLGRSHAHGNR